MKPNFLSPGISFLINWTRREKECRLRITIISSRTTQDPRSHFDSTILTRNIEFSVRVVYRIWFLVHPEKFQMLLCYRHISAFTLRNGFSLNQIIDEKIEESKLMRTQISLLRSHLPSLRMSPTFHYRILSKCRRKFLESHVQAAGGNLVFLTIISQEEYAVYTDNFRRVKFRNHVDYCIRYVIL